ncbi:MAG: PEP-CTERM sorting domain-containing protein [Leptolyngbyaceae cyanobacterium RU_5_1]|nr:PEP-CTERM sorting domain-containing protein [Leptolyngbyaceae cyanobacterium RU_5_1]
MTVIYLLGKLGIATVGMAASLAALDPSSAQAFITYTNRDAFKAAVSGFPITTETFDLDIDNAPTITFASGVVSTGEHGAIINQVTSGQYIGDVDTSGEIPDRFGQIRFQFPTAIAAFGADFLEVTTTSGLTMSGNFDGTGTQTISFKTLLGFPGTGFLGIVGTAPFSEIIFQEEGLLPGNEAFVIDNLVIAEDPTVSAAAVPEPFTILGSLAAIGGGIVLRRRQ